MNTYTLNVLEYHKVIEILATYSISSVGKEKAKNLKPFTDFSSIERLIAETTELKQLLHPNRSFPIAGLYDVSPILDKLETWNDGLSIDEVLQVGSTVRTARMVKEYLETGGEYPALVRIKNTIGTFTELEETIENTVDNSGLIKDTASTRLKSIRKKIQIKRKRVRDKLSSLVRSNGIGLYLQDENVRENENRPTIAVMASHAAKVKGKCHGRSDSGKTVYIEPDTIRLLGDELEEALFDEKIEISRLLNAIAEKILEQEKVLKSTVESLAHLEVTYAKVRFSRNYGMHPPVLNTDGIIKLRKARHPLLVNLEERGEMEQTTPIDVQLGDDFFTLIITGPNTGGKTVALKTIGLLTLMAQSGMHVPVASYSQLAVFKGIWADIGDEQSIEQSLSTFSGHLTHIAEILKNTGEQNLVLLDELGGGTDPMEGEALADSILRYLHQRKTRTVVTTHLSPLKNLAYTVNGVENASIEFNLETLRPTYRLLLGIPGQSNALALAKRLNLPQIVINEAERYSSQDETGNLLNSLQAARSKTLENRASTESALNRVKMLEQETQIKLLELESQLKLAKQQNGESAYEVIRQVRDQIEELLKDEPSKKSLLTFLSGIVESLKKELNNKNQTPRKSSFQIGNKVRVKSIGRTGVVHSLNESKRTAVISLGSMQIEVAQDDIGRVK